MERLVENIYPYGRQAGVITPYENFQLYENTPVEYYPLYNIFVKREDMCCNVERFSKARGFLPELTNIKEQGLTIIGWEEAGDYRAAKCVASICKYLNLELHIWGKPIEKLPKEVREVSQLRLKDIEKYGAKIHFYDRKYLVKIHWYKHRHEVQYMIPLGGDKSFMKLGISQEVKKTDLTNIKEIVVCMSTGGLLQGLLQGTGFLQNINNIFIYAILIQERKPIKLTPTEQKRVKFIDMGWKYYDLSSIYPLEFPCNLQYDAKAWKWLIENRKILSDKVLFWNAGG